MNFEFDIIIRYVPQQGFLGCVFFQPENIEVFRTSNFQTTAQSAFDTALKFIDGMKS